MKMTELYPSRFLSADDLDGEVPVTIASIKFEKMKDNDGNEQDKPVLFFLKTEKGLVLNKTNAKRIAEIHGDETDGWIGKKITLYQESVTAFGETKWAIRVKPVPPPAKSGALKAQPETVPADDSVPF
jgi:hypothetical protein